MMSRWLKKFLEKDPQTKPDKPDRFAQKANMSVLSVSSRDIFDKNSKNISLENTPQTGTDKTDKHTEKENPSGLSGPTRETLNKNSKNINLGNIPRVEPDKTDKIDGRRQLSDSMLSPSEKISFYHLDGQSLINDYEERLAIAEYDGDQTNSQAQRIAYLDAFVSVIMTLPQENLIESHKEDWLDHRIKEAKKWLISQGLKQPG